MSVTKFAISVPEETMNRVDRAAKRLGMTRSRYIAVVLARISQRERNADISRRVDEALADMQEQDLEPVRQFGRARRNEGTEW
jgi:metal-responsive CopG/Arc/MetJ family transcriptional regulator